MTASRPRVVTPRGVGRLLVDRAFGSLFWGKLLATNGVWMHAIAAAIIVFDRTGSALAVSLVGLAQSGPQVLLAPLSGSWSDRGDLVRQMILGRVLCAAGSGLLAVLLVVLGPGGPVVSAVLGCSLINGIGLVIGGPAMQAVVPLMIRDGELRTAMALNSAPMTLARVIGPVLGAFAVTHLNFGVVFGACAVLHLSFVLLLLVGRLPRRERPVGETSSGGVLAGLRHLRTQPKIVRMLLAAAAIGAAAEPVQSLAAPLGAHIGEGTQFVGHIVLCFGVGAIAMVVLTAWRRFRISAVTCTAVGLVVLAVGDVTVAFAANGAVLLVGAVLAGAGFSLGTTGSSTTIQHLAPEAYRGRIMALWLVAFIGARPLAGVALGGVADLSSIEISCIAGAALALFALPAVRRSRESRERGLSQRSEPERP